MTGSNWKSLASELSSVLNLQSPPVAITFSADSPNGVSRFDGPVPAPTADGRTGKVPAGCVFWGEAATKTFTTVAEDHGNCSVGSLTHGLKSLAELAGNEDVAALLASGWVTMEMVPNIPFVKQKPNFITYGPLSDTVGDPDVVFLRLNPKQVMVLHDAWPSLQFEGKPQCHIIPIAKESGQVAVSVGCMLSRVRTGLPNSEMTCAVPAARLGEVVYRLKETSRADNAVAGYAAADAKRFGR
jgi:uncharacterized protein (DUF169 family)